MVISDNKGDVTLKYKSEDYNIKHENKRNIILVPIMVIFILSIMACAIGVSLYLEKIGAHEAIVILSMFIIIAGAFAIVVLWCVYGLHRKDIPAYTTIDWLTRCKKIEAGYYKGEIRLRMHYSNGPIYRSLDYTLDSIKNKIVIDELQVKNKGDNIHITFDFTNPEVTHITIENISEESSNE